MALMDQPEYHAWRSMRRRIYGKNTKSFQRYGGRGITICPRWASFAAFLADMGPRPSSAHSLDRIDNDGHYEPGNCRWATALEQASNHSQRRGEQAPHVVLSAVQVMEIRRLHREHHLGYRRVSKMLGLSQWTVKDVLDGTTWAPTSVSISDFEPA